jgi:hypothetical protein
VPLVQLTRALRGGERTSPKTVLGFLALMTSIFAALTISITWLLAGTSSLHYLIPIIVGIFVLFFFLVVLAVVMIAWKDPSKLMLGQITGRDYVLIQQLTMGDNVSGDRTDNIVVNMGKLLDAEQIVDPSPDRPELPQQVQDKGGIL